MSCLLTCVTKFHYHTILPYSYRQLSNISIQLSTPFPAHFKIYIHSNVVNRCVDMKKKDCFSTFKTYVQSEKRFQCVNNTFFFWTERCGIPQTSYIIFNCIEWKVLCKSHIYFMWFLCGFVFFCKISNR